MDVLKKRVAYLIKEQVRMLDSKVLFDGTKLEVTSVDNLNTQVRVRSLLRSGPRYFLVKVSEQF